MDHRPGASFTPTPPRPASAADAVDPSHRKAAASSPAASARGTSGHTEDTKGKPAVVRDGEAGTGASPAGPYRIGLPCRHSGSDRTPPHLQRGLASEPGAGSDASTFTVLLQPYKDTTISRRPRLSAQQTGALARFGPPTLELGSIEGEHPHAARINVGQSCPPGTVLAVNAALRSAAESMNAVVHVVDTVHRTSLVLNLRLTFHQEARSREAAAVAAEEAKSEELRARLEAAHAEVAKAREGADGERLRANALEARIQGITAERDGYVQREEARRVEVERLRDNDRRRNAERQAAADRESAMDRLRERERRDLERRAKERDEERRAEEERTKEREGERRAVAWEMHRIDQERQQFVRERAAFESERRGFEAERERFTEREAEWRMHMHKALSEVAVCKACSARHVTEQHLKFTQERLARSLEEKAGLEAEVARLRAIEAARRTAELRIGPLPSTTTMHLNAPVPLRPLVAADVRFEGAPERATVEVAVELDFEHDQTAALAYLSDVKGSSTKTLASAESDQRVMAHVPGASWVHLLQHAPLRHSSDAVRDSTFDGMLGSLSNAGELRGAAADADAFFDPAAAAAEMAIVPCVDGRVDPAADVAGCPLEANRVTMDASGDNDLASDASCDTQPCGSGSFDHEDFVGVVIVAATRQVLGLVRGGLSLVCRVPAPAPASPPRAGSADAPASCYAVKHVLRFDAIRGRAPSASDLSRLLRCVTLAPRFGAARATSHAVWRAAAPTVSLSVQLALGVRDDGLFHILRREHRLDVKLVNPVLSLPLPRALKPGSNDALVPAWPLASSALAMEVRRPGAATSTTSEFPFSQTSFVPGSGYDGDATAKLFARRLVVSVVLAEVDGGAAPAEVPRHPSEVGEILLGDAASLPTTESSISVRVREEDGTVWVGTKSVGTVSSGRVNRAVFGARRSGCFNIPDGTVAPVGARPSAAEAPCLAAPAVQCVIDFKTVDDSAPFSSGDDPPDATSSTAPTGLGALVAEGCFLEAGEVLALLRGVGVSIANHPGRRYLHAVIEGREERAQQDLGGGSDASDSFADRYGSDDEADDSDSGSSPARLQATRVNAVSFRDVHLALATTITAHAVPAADIAAAPRTVTFRTGVRSPPAFAAALPEATCMLVPRTTVAARGERTGGVTISVDVEYPEGPIVAGDALVLAPWRGAAGVDKSGGDAPKRPGRGAVTYATSEDGEGEDPGHIIEVSSRQHGAVTRWELFGLRERCVVATAEARKADPAAASAPRLRVTFPSTGLTSIRLLRAALQSLSLRAGLPTTAAGTDTKHSRQVGLRVEFGERLVLNAGITVAPAPPLLRFPFHRPVPHVEGAGPQCVLAPSSHATNRFGAPTVKSRAAGTPAHGGMRLADDAASSVLYGGLVLLLRLQPPLGDAGLRAQPLALSRGTSVSVAQLQSSHGHAANRTEPASLSMLRRIPETTGDMTPDSPATVASPIDSPTAAWAAFEAACHKVGYTAFPLPPEAVESIHPDAHGADPEAFGIARASDGVHVARAILSDGTIELRFASSVSAGGSGATVEKRRRRASLTNRPVTGISSTRPAATSAVDGDLTAASTPKDEAEGRGRGPQPHDVAGLLHAITFHATQAPRQGDGVHVAESPTTTATTTSGGGHACARLMAGVQVVATELATCHQHHFVVGVHVIPASSMLALALPDTVPTPRITPPSPRGVVPRSLRLAQTTLLCPGAEIRRPPIDFGRGSVIVTVSRRDADAASAAVARCFLRTDDGPGDNFSANLSVATPSRGQLPLPGSTLLRSSSGGRSVFARSVEAEEWEADGPGTEARTLDPGLGCPRSLQEARSATPGSTTSVYLDGRRVGTATDLTEEEASVVDLPDLLSPLVAAARDHAGRSPSPTGSASSAATAVEEDQGSRHRAILRLQLSEVTPAQLGAVLNRLAVAVAPSPHHTAGERQSVLVPLTLTVEVVPPDGGSAMGGARASLDIPVVVREPLVCAPSAGLAAAWCGPQFSDALRCALPRVPSVVVAGKGLKFRPFMSCTSTFLDKVALPPGAAVWFGLEPGPLTFTAEEDTATRRANDGAPRLGRKAKTAPAVAAAVADPNLDAVSLDFPVERGGYTATVTSSDTSMGLQRVIHHGARNAPVAELLLTAQRVVVASSRSAPLTGRHLAAILRCLAMRGPTASSHADHHADDSASAGSDGQGRASASQPAEARRQPATRLQRVWLLWWEGPGTPVGCLSHDVVVVCGEAGPTATLTLHCDDLPIPSFIGHAYRAFPAGTARIALRGKAGDGGAGAEEPTVARVSVAFAGTSSSTSSVAPVGADAPSSGGLDSGPTLPWAAEAVGFDLEQLNAALGWSRAAEEDLSPDAFGDLPAAAAPPLQLQRTSDAGPNASLEPVEMAASIHTGGAAAVIAKQGDVVVDTVRGLAIARLTTVDPRRGVAFEVLEGAAACGTPGASRSGSSTDPSLPPSPFDAAAAGPRGNEDRHEPATSVWWATQLLHCVTYVVGEEPAAQRRGAHDGSSDGPMRVPARRFMMTVTTTGGSVAARSVVVQPLRGAEHGAGPNANVSDGSGPVQRVRVVADVASRETPSVALFGGFRLFSQSQARHFAGVGGLSLPGQGLELRVSLCGAESGDPLTAADAAALGATRLGLAADADPDALRIEVRRVAGLLHGADDAAAGKEAPEASPAARAAEWAIGRVVARGTACAGGGFHESGSPAGGTERPRIPAETPAALIVVVGGAPVASLLVRAHELRVEFTDTSSIPLQVIERVVQATALLRDSQAAFTSRKTRDASKSVSIAAPSRDEAPRDAAFRSTGAFGSGQDAATSAAAFAVQADTPSRVRIELSLRTAVGAVWRRAAIMRLEDEE